MERHVCMQHRDNPDFLGTVFAQVGQHRAQTLFTEDVARAARTVRVFTTRLPLHIGLGAGYLSASCVCDISAVIAGLNPCDV